MSVNLVNPPFMTFKDVDGDPLESGYIYIGNPGLNAEASPKTAYFDQDKTIVASQPIRTVGGFPVYLGSPARIFVDGDYSIVVKDRRLQLVQSALNSVVIEEMYGSIADFGGVGDDSTENAAAFQAAEEALAAGKIGAIYLPPGTYLCSEAQYIPTGNYVGPGRVRFGGDGTYTDTLSYPAPQAPGPIYSPLFNDDKRALNTVYGSGAGGVLAPNSGGNRFSTFVGDRAGSICTAALRSTAVGAWAMLEADEPEFFDAFGASAMQFARKGNRNFGFGNNAGKWLGTNQAVTDLHDFFNGTNETLESGTAQGGTSSTLTLDASSSFTANDEINGFFIVTTGGTGAGQDRIVDDYVGSSKVATVTPNWTTAPDSTTTYNIVQRDLSVWVNKEFEDIYPNVRDDLDGSTASVYSGSPRTPENLTQFGDVASSLIPASNSDCEDNGAVGRDALIHGLTVTKVLALGYKSFAQMLSGTQSVAVGRSAGEMGIWHEQDIAIGNSAMFRAISTQQNVVVGYGAARDAAAMSRNVVIGSEALEDAADAQADSSFQLTSNTDWQVVGNTIVGQRGGANLNGATGNTFFGTKMGQDIGSAETRTAEAILAIGNGDYNSAVPTIAGDMATGRVIVNGHHDGFDGSTDAAALLAQLTVVHGDLTAAIPAPQTGARGLLIYAETGATGLTIACGDGSNGNIFFQDAADNNVGGVQYDHSADDMNIRANDATQLIVKGTGTINMPNLPTSSAGLDAGDWWNNSGVPNIVP